MGRGETLFQLRKVRIGPRIDHYSRAGLKEYLGDAGADAATRSRDECVLSGQRQACRCARNAASRNTCLHNLFLSDVDSTRAHDSAVFSDVIRMPRSFTANAPGASLARRGSARSNEKSPVASEGYLSARLDPDPTNVNWINYCFCTEISYNENSSALRAEANRAGYASTRNASQDGRQRRDVFQLA